MILILRYISFAFIAIVINIFFQHICLIIYHDSYSLYVSMFFGTLMGLIVKYTLDKKYIFQYVPEHKKNERKQFVLYSFMGILTTFIFWGVELTFDSLFDNKVYRYLGAFLGLSLGYMVKYLLDKKYVFK